MVLNEENEIKVNQKFREVFTSICDFEFPQHYSKLLPQIKDSNQLVLKFLNSDEDKEISLTKLLQKHTNYNDQAFMVTLNGEERLFNFSSYDLINIYSKKTF